MEKVVGEQDLALQQHVARKSSKFSENSNCHINLLLNVRASNLAILLFLMCSFHFLGKI